MMRLATALAACSVLWFGTASARAATQPVPATPQIASNPEMTRLFNEDQADRKGDVTVIDWGKVTQRDEVRRDAVRKLLQDGALQTGEDYRQAAFIFQHGHQPSDFLLAHTLAIVAVGKGEPRALWIASATLDRYLQTVGQPQIYGTQYNIPTQGEPSQGDYDRSLISDALRLELRVPPLSEQDKKLEAYRQEQASQTKP